MKPIHFIGIGGIGMSALARILIERGVPVTGSDPSTSAVLEELRARGATLFKSHAAENVTDAAMVVYSTAIGEDNPEYRSALEKKIPLIHRSELLAQLMQGRKALLVSGTHGKTTTTSLLAHVLTFAGLDPSYAVGGVVRSLGTNGHAGEGRYFVAEADESDGSFLKYAGFGAIITNIDNDHLDYWKDEEKLCAGFRQFALNISSPNHLFWCRDDQKLASLGLAGTSYGFSEKANLSILNFRQEGFHTYFDFQFEEKRFEEVELPLIGAHNVLNAAAVFGMALRLEVSEKKIRSALQTFQGVSRRAEKKGEAAAVQFYDDYAHHPTEILATLRALRTALRGHRLVVAFQPHRYTRTKECLDQFAEAFQPADELILTDLYSAGEAPIEGVTSQALLAKIQEKFTGPCSYVARPVLSDHLAHQLQPQDVLVTMGAGDVTRVGPEVLHRLKHE